MYWRQNKFFLSLIKPDAPRQDHRWFSFKNGLYAAAAAAAAGVDGRPHNNHYRGDSLNEPPPSNELFTPHHRRESMQPVKKRKNSSVFARPGNHYYNFTVLTSNKAKNRCETGRRFLGGEGARIWFSSSVLYVNCSCSGILPLICRCY